MVLDRELATYREHLIDLLQHEGKFVVIKGETILPETWDTYEEATARAFEHFGSGPLLVKKIQSVEPVHYFARDLPR